MRDLIGCGLPRRQSFFRKNGSQDFGADKSVRALLRQAGFSGADLSPDKRHQPHGDEAEHAADDDIGHALFRNSVCSSREGCCKGDEEATRAETHRVAREGDQRQRCAEDGEGMTRPAFRQCYSDEEAQWHADEGAGGP
jgi:hypothetical protein